MGNLYGGGIITDSLVLALDASSDRSYAGSGTTWTDLSGNGNDGTLSAEVVGTVSSSLNAMAFESASSDYITMGDSPVFTFGDGVTDSPFSVNAWVYVKTLTEDNYVVSKYGSGTSEWRLDTQNGEVEFLMYDQTNNGSIGRYYSTALSTDTWYNITGTYDGGSSESGIKIYLNGVQVDDTDTTSGTYVAMDDFSSALNIGAMTGPDRFFHGNIAMTHMYSKELTSTEVLQNYNATKGRFL